MKRGNFGITVIDHMNRIKKEILQDLEDEDDLDIKAVMKAFIELFMKLPKAVRASRVDLLFFFFFLTPR